jgi:DNA polymerase-3 subunit beta
MEIKINRDSLFRSVSKVQSIIEKRSNMPILSMILISAEGSHISLSATDLEISMQQTIETEVIKEGSITISGRKLFEILKESKRPDIYIKEKDNNWVYISDEKTQYNLACLPPEEYPVFVEPEDVTFIEMDCNILSEMINKTIFSVTMEEAGFKLSGIYIEKVAKEGNTFLRMVSTDGHRLSLMDKNIKDIDNISLETGVMIPKKGMIELNKLTGEGEKISIGFKQNNCVAKMENSLMVIRLLESKFPDYNSVIPSEVKYNVDVKREEILDGMKKMIILSSENNRGVKITLDNNNMELVSINPDLGDVKDNINIEFKNESLEMGFNPRYFIDAFQAMESEKVKLGFIDNSSPCLIKGEDDKGFLGIVMPMRI